MSLKKSQKESVQAVFYALLFSYFEHFTGQGKQADVTLNLLSEMSSWTWNWPETCLEFHRPALPAEHRAALLVAKSASGSVFYTSNISMQRRKSLKAHRSSANQEFACILWNWKVHRRFHNSILPVPILSQINAAHVPN
jgi:hypothetical protein